MTVDVSPLFVILIFAGLGLAAIGIFKVVRKIPAVSLSLILLYFIVSIFVSLIYLEIFGAFINEAGSVSEWIGASYTFAFLNLVILFGTFVSITYRAKVVRTIEQPVKLDIIVSSAVIVGVVFIELANLALSRSTAFPFGQATRYDFWDSYAFAPILETLLGTLILFVPFMATALAIYAVEARRPKIRIIMILSIVGYFLFLLGTGQVFHGYLIPASIIFGIYMMWKSIRKSRIIRLKTAVLGFSALLAVSVLAVSNIGQRGISDGNGIEGTIYRLLVVQGGVIWEAVDLRHQGYEGGWEDMVNGRSFLIYAILPSGLASQYDETGINLQGALPATAYLALGLFWATIISFVYGLLCGAVMRLLTWMFVTGQVLVMVVASYLWLWTFAAYARGSLGTMITPQYAIAWAVVGIWSLYRFKQNQRAKQTNFHRRMSRTHEFGRRRLPAPHVP